MRLKALDQVHISAVRPDAIRTGEEFEVSDSAGKDLMKKHPHLFAQVDAADVAEKSEPDAPQNKAEPAPTNKSDTKRSTK